MVVILNTHNIELLTSRLISTETNIKRWGVWFGMLFCMEGLLS